MLPHKPEIPPILYRPPHHLSVRRGLLLAERKRERRETFRDAVLVIAAVLSALVILATATGCADASQPDPKGSGSNLGTLRYFDSTGGWAWLRCSESDWMTERNGVATRCRILLCGEWRGGPATLWCETATASEVRR